MFPRLRSLVIPGTLLFGMACGGGSPSPDPAPASSVSPADAPSATAAEASRPTATPDAVTSPTMPDESMPVASTPDDAAADEGSVVIPPEVAAGAALTGEQVVEYICSQCHSMDPPPLKAPPLTHVARHLRQSFASVDEAVAHVVAFAPAPDAEHSILPAMAQERFGLMPPLPLPEPMLEAAARYIWTLSDGDDAEMESPGMGNGMMRRGGGAMHRGGGMGPGAGGGMSPRGGGGPGPGAGGGMGPGMGGGVGGG